MTISDEKRADLTDGDDNLPARRKRRGSRFARGAHQRTGLLAVVGAVFLVLVIGLLIAYSARREIARQLLVGWLEDRGVQAEVQFDRFDFNRLVASVRAGDADDPDLEIERAEVDFHLGMPWSGGLGVQPTGIRLVRPRIHARLVDGRLSLGSLDPLIEDLTSRPPAPDRGSPTVVIEDGRLLLAGPSGTLAVLADARIEDNRLIRLDAGLPPTRLQGEDLTLDLRRAGIAVRTRGDRSALAVVADVNAWTFAGLSGEQAALRLAGHIPYPQTARRQVHGPVDMRLTGQVAELAWQGGGARGVDLDLDFEGRGTGWVEAFALLGGLTGQITSEALSAGEARVTRAAVSLDGQRVRLSRRQDLRWSYEGGVRVAVGAVDQGSLSAEALMIQAENLNAGGAGGTSRIQSQLVLAAAALRQDSLALTDVAGEFDLDSRLAEGGRTSLEGGVRSRGGSWQVLGPVGPGDVPEQIALKRALQAFAFEAPGLTVQSDGGGTTVDLTRPARVQPVAGGEVLITALGRQALYSNRDRRAPGGSLLIQARGGGLPQARVEVPRYVMADGGIAAAIDGEAAFDFGLARGARLETAGMLRIGGGRTTYSAAACFPFSAALLDLGDNDVADVATQICPVEQPLLTIADGWRFEAQARNLRAAAPFLGMAVSDATARVSARDSGGALGIDAAIQSGLIRDTEAETRFHPLRGSGQVRLADQDWTGQLRLVEPSQGHRIADVAIRHAGRTGAGAVQFDATGIEFAPGGLKPGQISPLGDGLVSSPVTGRADFTGAFDWSPSGTTSGGRFVTPGIDFVSPLGAVEQLQGGVTFVSLAPLTTAPGQHLTIGRIGAFLPLTNVTVDLGLNAASLRVSSGRVAVAGGFVSLEPTEIPFDAGQSWDGVLVLERVQLGDLFATSSFADAVQLDAVVSGRLPFVYGPNGITIVGGEVHAVQPGRLSIAREALTGMAAAGGGEAVPPNTVQDFAYQALEHLWFDQLDAELNSLPQGRLGVLFTIHGRHDPPEEQQIRLGLVELLRRDFLNRVLPLPSGTQINLTLDTSFNLDQLIDDLMEIQRARNMSERNP